MTQESQDNSKTSGGARWAWGIGLLYASFAIGMLGLVAFCTTNRVDLVRTDYYQAGVEHQSRIDAESRAMSLTVKPTVERDDTGNAVVTIPGKGISGTIRLYRPDNPANDRQLEVAAEGPTTIPADQLVPGRYSVDLTWRAANGKTYATALPYHH